MKITKTIFSMAIAIMAAAIIFSSCSKDGGGKPVSGAFNGKITATIENDVPAGAAYMVPWNDTGFSGVYLTGKQLGEPETFSNKSFSITLPNSLPSGMRMVSVKQLFEDIFEVGGKPKYSDPDVRVTDVDFLVLNNALNNLIGYFVHASSKGDMECLYVFSDGEVTITGGSNLSVSLGEGWNRLYVSQKLITTKPQSGLKWYFGEFDD